MTENAITRLESWLSGYQAAWENRDADAAAALFTPDARYYETPYAEPFIGANGVRDYWARVTADQRDVQFASEVISEDRSISVARWSAKFKLASNDASVELNGIFVLRFNADGLCSELREWWHAR